MKTSCLPADTSFYTVSYSNNTKIGTATVTIEAEGSRYKGTITKTFEINKGNNTLTCKGRTAAVEFNKLQKKDQFLSCGKVITFINKGQGSKTYKLMSAKKGRKNFKKRFAINERTGKTTEKKGLKTGTFKVKVKVRAAGNTNYEASPWNTVKIWIRIV